jgi:uncharacterized SAM-binding protein YcdF (DUF218 family)
MNPVLKKANSPSRLYRSGCRVSLSVLLLLILGLFSGRAYLLQGAADLWVTSDPIGSADAVAVFGGGLQTRPFAAATYFQRGIVPKILISAARTEPTETLGIAPSQTELNRGVLVKLGVPQTAIEVFGDQLSNTYEEAVALRQWAKRSQATTIIVPTEVFSTRRVKWTLQHVFAGSGVRIQVPSLEPLDYRAQRWWQKEQGLIAFQNEVVKFVYYRIRYGLF